MMRTPRLIAWCVVALTPALVSAQRPETRLTRPDFRSRTEFSSIAGFRELSPRAALVVDGTGRALLRLDIERNTIDTLGRPGAALGQYRSPDRLVPMPGGNTLLADLGTLRLWLLGPDGKPGESFPMLLTLGSRQVAVVPRAADAEGRLYFEVPKQKVGMPDSLLVLRLDVRSRRTDTMATVRALDSKLPQSRSGGVGTPFPRPVPFSRADAWAVAADGRIALARAAGPRLEWITKGGRLRKGSVIALAADPVTDADKLAFARRFGNEELLVGTTTRRDGTSTTRVQRGWGEVGTSWFTWPDRKAPFERDGLHVTSSGEAWLERAVPAGEPTVVEVFGPDAVRRGRMVLPRGRSIVGFGAGVVYLKVLSSSGKFTLERYRL